MSLLFLSVCLFLFSFCSLSLCMSPATHYVGPCHEFKISGVTAWEEGRKKCCHSKHPSHVLYNKVDVVCRKKKTERSTYSGFSCLFYLILLLLLLIFSRNSKWRFLFLCSVTHLGPETGRRACQLLLHHLHWFSCLELAGVSPGLVFQKPLYHVPAHYHVLTRTNAGNLTPEARSRTLRSPPSSLFFNSSPHSSLTNSHIFVLPVLQHFRAFCSSKVTDALPDPPTTPTPPPYIGY